MLKQTGMLLPIYAVIDTMPLTVYSLQQIYSPSP
jgi:hypothetical protein